MQRFVPSSAASRWIDIDGGGMLDAAAVRCTGMSLALDHVSCVVDDPDQAVMRIQSAGWVLDAGSVHAGQGTRNRRLVWREQYLELVWVADALEARTNPLRLDRRGDWVTTGASPLGFGLRGQLPDSCRGDYWLYEELGPRIWVHHDNEQAPERPLVFVLELTAEDREQRQRAMPGGGLPSRQTRRPLEEVRVRAPAPARLPPHTGPRIVHSEGTPTWNCAQAPDRRDRSPTSWRFPALVEPVRFSIRAPADASEATAPLSFHAPSRRRRRRGSTARTHGRQQRR
jgi:glyoxalase-like protein